MNQLSYPLHLFHTFLSFCLKICVYEFFKINSSFEHHMKYHTACAQAPVARKQPRNRHRPCPHRSLDESMLKSEMESTTERMLSLSMAVDLQMALLNMCPSTPQAPQPGREATTEVICAPACITASSPKARPRARLPTGFPPTTI